MRALILDTLKFAIYLGIITLAIATVYATSLALAFGLLISIIKVPYWEYVCILIFSSLLVRDELRLIRLLFVTRLVKNA